MVDFSYLNDLNINESKTVEYELHQISGSPVLVIAPATPDNKPFFNEALKKKKSRGSVKSVTISVVESNRAEDKESFVNHVVKGWRGIVDQTGAEVPFTKENLRQFLFLLPDWIFDDLRVFASTPENFVDNSACEDLIKN